MQEIPEETLCYHLQWQTREALYQKLFLSVNFTRLSILAL